MPEVFGGFRRLFWQPDSCVTQTLEGIASIVWVERCSAANSRPLPWYPPQPSRFFFDTETLLGYSTLGAGQGAAMALCDLLCHIVPVALSKLNIWERMQQKSFRTEETSFYLFPSVFSESHVLSDSELALVSCQHLLKMEKFYL